MQAHLRPHPRGIPHRYGYFGKAHVCAGNLTIEALGAQGFLCDIKMLAARSGPDGFDHLSVELVPFVAEFLEFVGAVGGEVLGFGEVLGEVV